MLDGNPLPSPFYSASKCFRARIRANGTSKKTDKSKWVLCSKSHKIKAWAKEHVVFLEKEYVQAVFACTPQERQSLSWVDVTVDICRKYSGALVAGKLRDGCLLERFPLVQWDDNTTPKVPKEETV
jgi:hypothetical protein